MASHLTITSSSSAGISSSKGLKAQASAGAETEGGFAALLGAASQQASTAASTETTTETSLGTLVDLSFGAGFGSEGGEETEDPSALAAVIDAVLPIQAPVETNPALAELVDSLGELKLDLEAGEPLDPELLQRIDAALSDLAAELDIDPASLPSLDDLKALATTILPDDTSVAAQLTSALAPLAETLLTGTEEVSADAELPAQLKSVGEKLAALLQSLNSGDIDSDKLAALGLDDDTAIDADLEAALAKLVNPPVKLEASATTPVLAAPSLKLTEPVLTGKPAADATASATASVEPTTETSDKPETTLQVAAVGSAETGTGSGGSTNGEANDPKPTETTALAATAVAAAVETPVDPQVAAQPTHVASRIDAAAARPVVQPGYQTSQQQLNLPQLAFELARQVNGGQTSFQLRLDPAELGKVDVRLDIDASGQVNARLTVERAETLDLMQRDQRALEKALQQAGLDSAKTNLEFSLKQNSSGGQQGQDGNGRQSLFGAEADAGAEDVSIPTINLYRGSLTASGVNIIA